MLQAAVAGKIETLVLLGADPLCDFPDRNLAAEAIQKVKTVVAIDNFVTASVAKLTLFCRRRPTENKGHHNKYRRPRQQSHPKNNSPRVDSRWLDDRDGACVASWWRLGLTSKDEIWREIEKVAPSHTG
ncbi:MAG: hypothetical protein Ct9H300mP26_5120 [Acidimicrobiales bacterium]|nr:MAG: hypothetical protein Ct9H300mP26_5120 [Acidimicrobiales bacterium]